MEADRKNQDKSSRIPTDENLARMFREQALTPARHQNADVPAVLRLTSAIDETGSASKGATKQRQKIASECLWPVVVLERSGIFLLGIPLVDGAVDKMSSSNARVQAVKLPCVTATLILLDEIAQCLGPHPVMPQMSAFQRKLCAIMPFGTPVLTQPQNVAAILSKHSRRLHSSEAHMQARVPAWKPLIFSSNTLPKAQIDLWIKEDIRGSSSSRCDVSGAVVVATQLPGLPTVTMPMKTTSKEKGAVSIISVHECVRGGVVPAIRFSPPHFAFDLCRYCSGMPRPPPLTATLHVTRASVSVLRVRMRVRATSGRVTACRCSWCAGAGVLRHMLEATSGALKWEKQTLHWQPVVGAEEVVEGTVALSPDGGMTDLKQMKMNVFYECEGATVSGFDIDTDGILIDPPCGRFQVRLRRSVVATDIAIANSAPS